MYRPNIPTYIYYNRKYDPAFPYDIRLTDFGITQVCRTLDEAVFFRNLFLDIHNKTRPDWLTSRNKYPLPDGITPPRYYNPTFKTNPDPINLDPTTKGYDPQVALLIDLSKDSQNDTFTL